MHDVAMAGSFPVTSVTLIAKIKDLAPGEGAAAWVRFWDMYQGAIRQFAALKGGEQNADDIVMQVLGKLVLTYEGEELGQVNLVAVSGAQRSELLYRLDQVKRFFAHPLVRIITVIVLLVVAALVLRAVLVPPRRRGRYGNRRYSGRRNYRGRRR